jgi:hypothetical protein
MHKSETNNDRVLCRFGINTAFLNREKDGLQSIVKMDKNYLCPNSIKKTKEYDQFKVKMVFNTGCKDKVKQCIDPADPFLCNYCKGIMENEVSTWSII